MPLLPFLLLPLLTTSSFLRSLPEEPSLISSNFTLITKHNYPITPVSIGTPPQEFSLIIDIGSERTWIHQSDFNSKISTSYKSSSFTESKHEDTFSYRGTSSTETFLLPSSNTQIPSFPFLLVDHTTDTSLISGVLSLGREYDSKQYSFLHHLSHFHSFSLNFLSNGAPSSKGTLNIGDTSRLFTESETAFIDKCNVVHNKQYNIKWGCQLTHVFVGDIDNGENDMNKVLDVKEEVCDVYASAYFETVYDKILFPFYNGGAYEDPIFAFLERNYFVNEKKEKVCKKVKNDSELKYECAKGEVEKLKKVYFVFEGKVALYLDAKELFRCVGEVCEFAVGAVRDVERVVMGVTLMRRFHMVFDYNEYEVRFYSKNNKAKVDIQVRKEGMPVWKVFLYFVLTVVALGGLGLMYIYISRKKNESKKLIQQQIYKKFTPNDD